MGNGALYMEEEERKKRIRNFMEYLMLCLFGGFIALLIIAIVGSIL